jgi:hypothetical protein
VVEEVVEVLLQVGQEILPQLLQHKVKMAEFLLQFLHLVVVVQMTEVVAEVELVLLVETQEEHHHLMQVMVEME